MKLYGRLVQFSKKCQCSVSKKIASVPNEPENAPAGLPFGVFVCVSGRALATANRASISDLSVAPGAGDGGNSSDARVRLPPGPNSQRLRAFVRRSATQAEKPATVEKVGRPLSPTAAPPQVSCADQNPTHAARAGDRRCQ